MTREELERASASGKFKSIEVENILHYPDGSTGFVFAHLAYVDNVDEIFAAEREQRRKLVTETIMLNSEQVAVAHSVFDGGMAKDMFDGDTYTLARGLEANPLIVEIQFPTPRAVERVEGIFAQMSFKWTVFLYTDDVSPPVEYSAEYRGQAGEPNLAINFDRGSAQVSKIRMEIQQYDAPEPAHIHIRELMIH